LPDMNYGESKTFLESYNEIQKNQDDAENVGNFKMSVYDTKYGKAIMTTYNITCKSKEKALAVRGIVSNGKNAIFFVGEDYQDGVYSDKFKETFDSIEE